MAQEMDADPESTDPRTPQRRLFPKNSWRSREQNSLESHLQLQEKGPEFYDKDTRRVLLLPKKEGLKSGCSIQDGFLDRLNLS